MGAVSSLPVELATDFVERLIRVSTGIADASSHGLTRSDATASGFRGSKALLDTSIEERYARIWALQNTEFKNVVIAI